MKIAIVDRPDGEQTVLGQFNAITPAQLRRGLCSIDYAGWVWPAVLSPVWPAVKHKRPGFYLSSKPVRLPFWEARESDLAAVYAHMLRTYDEPFQWEEFFGGLRRMVGNSFDSMEKNKKIDEINRRRERVRLVSARALDKIR